MIKVENIDVSGFEAAIRGCRTPYNNWDKSDSTWEPQFETVSGSAYGSFVVGPNDLKLMRNLAKAGDDHGKFLRMINVSFDLTAPLYFWKQMDQYRIGVTTNSTSIMNSIYKREFTIDDFSHEHLISDEPVPCKICSPKQALEVQIKILNTYRELYLETKNKKYWWQIIQLLPIGYNQKRTVQLNYQVLMNIYHARKNHKLDCWRDFCEWMKNDLPYFKYICLGEE